MIDAIVYGVLFVLAFAVAIHWGHIDAQQQNRAAKPETLTCVRVKEVTPAGTINYLCEVRK